MTVWNDEQYCSVFTELPAIAHNNSSIDPLLPTRTLLTTRSSACGRVSSVLDYVCINIVYPYPLCNIVFISFVCYT